MCDKSSAGGSRALHSRIRCVCSDSSDRTRVMSLSTPLSACGWWSCERFCNTHSSVKVQDAETLGGWTENERWMLYGRCSMGGMGGGGKSPFDGELMPS